MRAIFSILDNCKVSVWPINHTHVLVACFLGLLSTAFGAPISFPQCPAVGANTSGCELLITVTTTSGGHATAFTVTASSPDLGSFNGFSTLIGIQNASSGGLNDLTFRVEPGTGTFAFNLKGACLGVGSPLVSAYSPGPAATDCLQGQFQTADAFDYASSGVSFLSFNLAAASVLTRSSPGQPLSPGQSTWFSLPGIITANQISMVPEPSALALSVVGLVAFGFARALQVRSRPS